MSKLQWYSSWLNAHYCVKLSRLIALFSFVLGTSLFFLYGISHNTAFEKAGFLFLLAASIINLLLLFLLLYFFMADVDARSQLMVSLFFLLLNIPYAFLYYFMAEEISRSLYID